MQPLLQFGAGSDGRAGYREQSLDSETSGLVVRLGDCPVAGYHWRIQQGNPIATAFVDIPGARA